MTRAPNVHPSRRSFLQHSAASMLALPALSIAQPASSGAERSFSPQPGNWRSFEVTHRVDVLKVQGETRVWIPVPAVDSDYQRSDSNSFSSSGKAELLDDSRQGIKLLYAQFTPADDKPYVELVSRVQTQNRATNWSQQPGATQDPAALQYWTRPTALLPTDGIVRSTALQATRGARTDLEKAQKLYEWVVSNTYREPKVRGCGDGDIKTMLETGNLGGKCADLNALYVGMSRSLGIPARDVYGIRLVPSAFGYKELSGNPASLKGAQHCRAEVFLQGYGWVAMDPADVAKVMRMETPEWLKTTLHPVVAPVNKALFGGWEGNWMAYNTAHDVVLPNSRDRSLLGFFMYPAAENDVGRFDSYAPDDFRYQITAREISA